MDMEIKTSYDDGAAVLELGGHLNTNTASELENALEPVLESTNRVVLDFDELEYFSSAGLRVLVAAQKKTMKADGTLRIVNVIDDIREVFDATGLSDVFDVE
ncbi:anti-sigma factor antagonist [Paraeggerthella hongkongensis]|uniref:STAS domain-containing protein n=1 Tax=Paraeggerthella sp. TaxID=2897350 RepID=UPI000DF77657|nr:anti-sigma factor antagonist [Paraeggerthella hongkongensis]